jgi:regulator of replication initiation timing
LVALLADKKGTDEYIKKLEGEAEGYSGSASERLERIEELEAEIKALKKNIEELSYQAGSLNAENKSLLRDLRKNPSTEPCRVLKHRKLEEENAELKRQLEELKKTSSVPADRPDSLIPENTRLAEENEKLRGDLANTEAALADALEVKTGCLTCRA